MLKHVGVIFIIIPRASHSKLLSIFPARRGKNWNIIPAHAGVMCVIKGSRNPLRTSTWCGLVGTNGRCAPLLSAKVGICQLKISIGTRKSTLTATKHQDNSLSDIRLQDSTRTMMTRWRFAEDFSRKPHRSSTRCALVGTDGRCALSLSAKVSKWTRNLALRAIKPPGNSFSAFRSHRSRPPQT